MMIFILITYDVYLLATAYCLLPYLHVSDDASHGGSKERIRSEITSTVDLLSPNPNTLKP